MAADQGAVWDVVLDLTGWASGATSASSARSSMKAAGAEPGARFRGRNRQGIFRWGRVCEVLSTEDHEAGVAHGADLHGQRGVAASG